VASVSAIFHLSGSNNAELHIAMEPIDVPPSSGVQPIAMDVTGDLRVDLLGLTTSNSRTLKVWSNTWNASTPSAPLFNVSAMFSHHPEYNLMACV
jgi:hypothetical protein